MNIFYLDENVEQCAAYHCDKHVVKMIIEYAQILCTAHRVLDNNTNEFLYKATHMHHPCTVWAMQSAGNYNYLYNLFIALSKEYTHRYKKTHKTYEKLYEILKGYPVSIANDTAFTTPPQCMDDEFKNPHTITAYRNLYNHKKSKFTMKYTNATVPVWLV